MKIKNSTKSFNLYSSASKYNINISGSRYKLAAYVGLVAIICLAALVSFTYYYILAQLVAIVAIISLSYFLSYSNDKDISYSILMSKAGSVQLLFEPTNVPAVNYQLIAGSRCSFIGLWLVLKVNKLDNVISDNEATHIPTEQLFIFRDSISAQDYSRIANTIKQL